MLEMMEKRRYVKLEIKNKRTGKVIKENYTFLDEKGDIELQVTVRKFYSTTDDETIISQIIDFYYIGKFAPSKTIITTPEKEITEIR